VPVGAITADDRVPEESQTDVQINSDDYKPPKS
jgi:hypothetical protein